MLGSGEATFDPSVATMSVEEMMGQLNKRQAAQLDKISLKMNMNSPDLYELGRLSPQDRQFLVDLNDLYDGHVEWLKNIMKKLGVYDEKKKEHDDAITGYSPQEIGLQRGT